MRNPALQERRNRQILADIVRTYIETGMMGEVLDSYEKRISVLTYPEEEKSVMRFLLREAAAKGPEILAKVMWELGPKLMTGG